MGSPPPPAERGVCGQIRPLASRCRTGCGLWAMAPRWPAGDHVTGSCVRRGNSHPSSKPRARPTPSRMRVVPGKRPVPRGSHTHGAGGGSEGRVGTGAFETIVSSQGKVLGKMTQETHGCTYTTQGHTHTQHMCAHIHNTRAHTYTTHGHAHALSDLAIPFLEVYLEETVRNQEVKMSIA